MISVVQIDSPTRITIQLAFIPTKYECDRNASIGQFSRNTSVVEMRLGNHFWCLSETFQFNGNRRCELLWSIYLIKIVSLKIQIYSKFGIQITTTWRQSKVMLVGEVCLLNRWKSPHIRTMNQVDKHGWLNSFTYESAAISTHTRDRTHFSRKNHQQCCSVVQ